MAKKALVARTITSSKPMAGCCAPSPSDLAGGGDDCGRAVGGGECAAAATLEVAFAAPVPLSPPPSAHPSPYDEESEEVVELTLKT